MWEKKQVKSGEKNKWKEFPRGGGEGGREGRHESFRIPLIARVRNKGSLFKPFLYAFCKGTGSCLHGGPK